MKLSEKIKKWANENKYKIKIKKELNGQGDVYELRKSYSNNSHLIAVQFIQYCDNCSPLIYKKYLSCIETTNRFFSDDELYDLFIPLNRVKADIQNFKEYLENKNDG